MTEPPAPREPPAPLAGRGRIGLALGSGAAKGWAHIGVIRALQDRGVHPEIVCGTSMGAVVGAAHASDRLDAFEEWAESLEWTNVVGYLDLAMRGGLIKARRLFEFFADELADARIEDLPRPFATVGTDLATGQEVWLREGRLIDALRATIALPGLITPARWNDRWMVDGGLVNPVPVSLARALGADFVIAVDLNTTLLERRFRPSAEGAGSARIEDDDEEVVAWNGDAADPERADRNGDAADPERADRDGDDADAERADRDGDDADAERAGRGGEQADAERAAAESGLSLPDRLNLAFREIASEVRERLGSDAPRRPNTPGVYDVVANSINIMQVRITRSRMAGDPPELLVTPRLLDFGLLEFDRSAEAISEGRRAVERAWAAGFSSA